MAWCVLSGLLPSQKWIEAVLRTRLCSRGAMSSREVATEIYLPGKFLHSEHSSSAKYLNCPDDCLRRSELEMDCDCQFEPVSGGDYLCPET